LVPADRGLDVFFGVTIWMLFAFVVAVRQALDYAGSPRPSGLRTGLADSRSSVLRVCGDRNLTLDGAALFKRPWHWAAPVAARIEDQFLKTSHQMCS
jgi:hypothetical protein